VQGITKTIKVNNMTVESIMIFLGFGLLMFSNLSRFIIKNKDLEPILSIVAASISLGIFMTMGILSLIS
jgi:hypothetical protein